jgi:hypothetical protein
MMFFLAIAGTTQGLEVAHIVAATCREGNNVIDRQVGGLSAALALMVVTVEYIFPYFFGEANSFRFFWHIILHLYVRVYAISFDCAENLRANPPNPTSFV